MNHGRRIHSKSTAPVAIAADAVSAMEDHHSLLQRYELIAGLTGQMLAEARAQHWDAVVSLGERYCDAVEALRDLDELDNSARAARRQLLEKILDDDANIRLLAAPELGRLGVLLGDLRRQRVVMQAYAPDMKQ